MEIDVVPAHAVPVSKNKRNCTDPFLQYSFPASSPCEFTSIMTCFRRIVQQGLTLNLTCTAASTSISCFKRLVTAGKITGCSMSEKEIIGKKLAESKRQQMHTCQSEFLYKCYNIFRKIVYCGLQLFRVSVSLWWQLLQE